MFFLHRGWRSQKVLQTYSDLVSFSEMQTELESNDSWYWAFWGNGQDEGRSLCFCPLSGPQSVWHKHTWLLGEFRSAVCRFYFHWKICHWKICLSSCPFEAFRDNTECRLFECCLSASHSSLGTLSTVLKSTLYNTIIK